MIKLERVSKFYSSGDNNVSLGLHNVSLEMSKGEIIGVVGESGSGKSTFLNVVSMLDTFEDGEIYYNGIPASSYTQEEIGEFRKNHIGFIFQNYNLIDSYTVLQNVLMPLMIKGINPKEAKERAKEIIKKVGLEHRIHHKGTKLSGGEKQRCVIARALASDSEILACDEPTGNLDSKTGREIIELIRDVAKDKLVIIVTHNYDELKDIITRRLTFADGNLIEDVKLRPKDNVNDELKPNSEFKFSFRDKVKLSVNDTFSTPRKSFISMLIFLAISAIVAYLYTGLITYQNSYSDPGIFNNIEKDRYVIYEKNNPMNYDDFKNFDYHKDAFCEDSEFTFTTTSIDRGAVLPRFDLSNIKLSKGRMPENEYEVVLGVPEEGLSTCYNEDITFNFGVAYRRYNNITVENVPYDHFVEQVGEKYEYVKYHVVGYYNIKDTTVNAYYVCGTKEFEEKVIETTKNSYALSFVSFEAFNSYNFNTRVDVNADIPDNVIKVKMPENLEGKFTNIEQFFKTYYDDEAINISDLGITYDLVYQGVVLECQANISTLRKLCKNNNYVSIYLKEQVKIDEMTNSLENKGYGVCNAKSAYIHEDISMASILNTILYAFYITGVIFAFVVIFLISYFILARIYSIKNKDYTVFRTLGMSKKDMASLVRIQTVIQSMTSTFVVLLAVLISYIVGHPLIKGFHRIGIFGIIVYIVFMFIYSLFFAIRFNRKLYKFSVQKTFRGGVLGND